MKRKYLIFYCLLFVFLLSNSAVFSNTSYSKDSDKDGYPDEIENATGYDPNINDAREKSKRGRDCGSISADITRLGNYHNVLIILDISGSMSAPIGDTTRMETAKSVLKKYVDALPRSMKIGLAVYGKTQCTDSSVELLVPIGLNNKKDIKQKISVLQPTGLTPIALSLKKSLDYYKGFEKDNNSLVLISDGMESCGGDPVTAMKELSESEAKPEVMVIGLDVDPNTQKHLKEIADTGGGNYVDVKNEDDFVQTFADLMRKLCGYYKDIVCLKNQFNKYLVYDSMQYNKCKSYIQKMIRKADDNTKKDLLFAENMIDNSHLDKEKMKKELDKIIKAKLKAMEGSVKTFIKK